MTLSSQYTANFDDGQSDQELVSRWKRPELRKRALAVREAIVRGEDLPEEVPMITATFDGASIRLADLRGIDLSGLRLKDVDLSYCCFASADFTGTTFLGTHIQYSSFANAKLDSTHWKEVQASPIFADKASFVKAHIEDSFVMGSSLNSAKFEKAELKNTAFSGSTLENASIELASRLTALDVAEAILPDSVHLRNALHDSFGTPRWSSNSALKSHRRLIRRKMILRMLKKNIIGHSSDNAFKFYSDEDFFTSPIVGEVIKGVSPAFAEVAVRIPSSHSAPELIKRLGHKHSFLDSNNLEGYKKLEEIVQREGGVLMLNVVPSRTQLGHVEPGDIVEIEKTSPRKPWTRNLHIKQSKSYTEPSSDCYIVGKVLKKGGVQFEQASSASKQYERGTPAKKKVRTVMVKKGLR